MNKIKQMLAKFFRIKNILNISVYADIKLRETIAGLPEKWQVYANELIAGISVDNVVKKYAKGKGTQQIKAHVTNALKAIGGAKKKKKATDYTVRTKKDAERWDFIDAMRQSKMLWNLKSKLILSLTSYQFVMEERINSFKSSVGTFKVLACEMEMDTVLKMYETIKEKKFDFVKQIFIGEISEIIRTAPPSTFAHVNLDFCASIKKFGADISIAVERKIVEVGGCIFITVSQRLKDTDTPKELMELVKKAGGKNYDYEVHGNGYTDGKGPMYSMIIRRIK